MTGDAAVTPFRSGKSSGSRGSGLHFMAFDSSADAAPEAGTPLDDEAFKAQLASLIPHLRAYGRSLSGNPDLADDLTQDTMVKAWASRDRFERGTSIKAWTFVILRNAYLTDMRRNRFRGDYDESVAERILTAPAGQEEPIHLADMRRASSLAVGAITMLCSPAN